MFEEIYDDYDQWLEQEKLLDDKIDEDRFKNILVNKYGNLSKKLKKLGWKNLSLNLD